MIRLFFVLLITLSLNPIIHAQVFEEFSVIPENPIEGEDIITRFAGVYGNTGFSIYTEDFEEGDHELSITVGFVVHFIGGQAITPFNHDHIWGELDEGRWVVNVLVRFYYWNEDMDELEFRSQEAIRFLFDVGEAEDQVRFCTRFRRGWQLISFPIIPNERDVTELFADFVEDDELYLLKDCNGHFFCPMYNFNNMPEWEPLRGYLLNLRRYYDYIPIVGVHHEERMETAIPLSEGWNIVAYLPDFEIPAVIAFQNIQEQLILAKDCDGNFYHPENDFCNMEPLKRRQGYYVEVSEDCELVWNVEE
ncbi:MAG: hypothetical protein P9X24_02555 [Candidatus Hatepunaea meridiana]|nr:hypothetical protein [Candidatus Hatepunaea meridiana]